jgi:hypothetical protein
LSPFVCVCVLFVLFMWQPTELGVDRNLLVDAVLFLSFTRATLRCFWIWICLYWGLPLADMPLTLNRFPTPVSFFLLYILVALPSRYAAYAQTGLQSLFVFPDTFVIHLCSLGLAHMPRPLEKVCQVCFAASMRCRSMRMQQSMRSSVKSVPQQAGAEEARACSVKQQQCETHTACSVSMRMQCQAEQCETNTACSETDTACSVSMRMQCQAEQCETDTACIETDTACSVKSVSLCCTACSVKSVPQHAFAPALLASPQMRLRCRSMRMQQSMRLQCQVCSAASRRSSC